MDDSGTCVRGEIHMLLVGDPGKDLEARVVLLCLSQKLGFDIWGVPCGNGNYGKCKKLYCISFHDG